ncbi:MAG: linear amide C-N hydrolase [Oscillospiraceae bacterium]|nr:linear amide C-N hydrolase [Oscillospiraceae bacterium]
MCTAVKFKKEKSFFGRNLDLWYSYNEKIVFVPRGFSLHKKEEPSTHFAMLGAACIFQGTPLFYDAVNEHGVYMAALNFPEDAKYFPQKSGACNIAPFEVIPWVLGRCSTAEEAANALLKVNVTNENFSPELPNTPLHWFLADKDKTYAIEPLSTGLSVRENPAEVLTNSPALDAQIKNLGKYAGISPQKGRKSLLPGDYSSESRFIRAFFVKENSLCDESETEGITQLFHILSAVEQPKGSVLLKTGEVEHTLYSSCATEEGKYCCKTYRNSRIFAVDIKKEHLDSTVLKTWPLYRNQDIFYQN